MGVKVEINKLLLVAERMAEFGFVKLGGSETLTVYRFVDTRRSRLHWYSRPHVEKRFGMLASINMVTPAMPQAKIKVYGREYLLPLVEKAKEISELCECDWTVSLESEKLGKLSVMSEAEFNYLQQT